MRLSISIWLGAMGALVGLARPLLAQTSSPRLPTVAEVTPVAHVTLPECYQALATDSVALYYNERWELTPMACATQRRLTRLDPDGSFNGEVQDYYRANNQLLFRQHYQHGQRTGSYEAFYPTGRPLLRGTFAQGQAVGEWQWWYANGRPMQTLRYDAAAPQQWRIVAYWDSTGQQLVTNGAGRWQQELASQQLRMVGAVLGELPDGEWQMTQLVSNKLLTTETYRAGRFVKGHNVVGRLPDYRDHARFLPAFDDPSVRAERYQLGISCAEQARRIAREQASGAQLAHQRALNERVKAMTPPRPDGYGPNYLHMLLEKMSDYPSLNALRLNEQYDATVEADLDEYGKLSNFQSKEIAVQRVFEQMLPKLGRWHAATVNQQPVKSRVRFDLHVLDHQWKAQYRVLTVDVSSAAPPPPSNPAN